MHIRTSFPYETTHDDVRIPLPDGTLLYARVWRPLTPEPVPAILEYLPYRLTDWTAPRDWQRHLVRGPRLRLRARRRARARQQRGRAG